MFYHSVYLVNFGCENVCDMFAGHFLAYNINKMSMKVIGNVFKGKHIVYVRTKVKNRSGKV